MNFIIENWWLVLIIVGSAAMLAWPLLSGQDVGLSPEQATQLVNRDNGVFVDLRDENTFAAGHITGAKNVPLKQLAEKLPGQVKNKNFPVILVCASGRSSFQTIRQVQQLGYTKVQILAGGMKAWQTANLPLKTK